MSAPKTITHLLPTGAIILWGGADMPNGFLLCNGASVSRSDYPDLAEALGETGTTFSLPDYRDRVPQGAGTVSPNVGVEAGIPELYGSFTARQFKQEGVEGLTADLFIASVEGAVGMFRRYDYVDENGDPISTAYPGTLLAQDGQFCHQYYLFNASRLDSTYGKSGGVQPSAWTAHFLIKS